MKLFILSIAVLLLTACNSTKDNNYSIIVPASKSSLIQPSTLVQSNGKFKIMYQKDEDGQNITKTINRSTRVKGSDLETLKDLRERAKKQIVQIATEEVNGIVINSTQKINTTMIQVRQGNQNQQYSRQNFTEDAVAQTAGIARITNMVCDTLPSRGSSLELACSGDVTVPLIKEIFIDDK